MLRDDGTTANPDKSGERSNLDDHIYERLKAMIVDGALLAGERIVPEQLAGAMVGKPDPDAQRPQAPIPRSDWSNGVRGAGSSFAVSPSANLL